MARTPFALKSGNTTAFKDMGSAFKTSVPQAVVADYDGIGGSMNDIISENAASTIPVDMGAGGRNAYQLELKALEHIKNLEKKEIKKPTNVELAEKDKKIREKDTKDTKGGNVVSRALKGVGAGLLGGVGLLSKGVLDVTKGVLGGTSDALGKIVGPIDDKLNEIKISNREKNDKRSIEKGNTKVNESGETVATSDMEVQKIKDADMRKTGKSQYQIDVAKSKNNNTSTNTKENKNNVTLVKPNIDDFKATTNPSTGVFSSKNANYKKAMQEYNAKLKKQNKNK
jgi:hypothetical protein